MNKNICHGISFLCYVSAVVMCVLQHVNVEHLFNFVTYWHIRSDAYTPSILYESKCVYGYMKIVQCMPLSMRYAEKVGRFLFISCIDSFH